MRKKQTSTSNMEGGMNRRRFLQSTAAAAGALAIGVDGAQAESKEAEVLRLVREVKRDCGRTGVLTKAAQTGEKLPELLADFLEKGRRIQELFSRASPDIIPGLRIAKAAPESGYKVAFNSWKTNINGRPFEVTAKHAVEGNTHFTKHPRADVAVRPLRPDEVGDCTALTQVEDEDRSGSTAVVVGTDKRGMQFQYRAPLLLVTPRILDVLFKGKEFTPAQRAELLNSYVLVVPPYASTVDAQGIVRMVGESGSYAGIGTEAIGPVISTRVLSQDQDVVQEGLSINVGFIARASAVREVANAVSA